MIEVKKENPYRTTRVLSKTDSILKSCKTSGAGKWNDRWSTSLFFNSRKTSMTRYATWRLDHKRRSSSLWRIRIVYCKNTSKWSYQKILRKRVCIDTVRRNKSYGRYHDLTRVNVSSAAKRTRERRYRCFWCDESYSHSMIMTIMVLRSFDRFKTILDTSMQVDCYTTYVQILVNWVEENDNDSVVQSLGREMKNVINFSRTYETRLWHTRQQTSDLLRTPRIRRRLKEIMSVLTKKENFEKLTTSTDVTIVERIDDPFRDRDLREYAWVLHETCFLRFR